MQTSLKSKYPVHTFYFGYNYNIPSLKGELGEEAQSMIFLHTGCSELLLSGKGNREARVASCHKPLQWIAVRMYLQFPLRISLIVCQESLFTLNGIHSER